MTPRLLPVLLALLLLASAAAAAPPSHANNGGNGQGPGNDAADAGPGNGNGGNGNGNGQGNGQRADPAEVPADEPVDAPADDAPGQSAQAPGQQDDEPAATQTPAESGSASSSEPAASAPGRSAQASGRASREAASASTDEAGSTPAAAPGRSAQAPGRAASAPEAPTVLAPATLPVQDASGSVRVAASPRGNVVSFAVDEPTAAQVQVWRLDGDAWVPVAAVPSASGDVVDPDGAIGATYRVTWSQLELAPAQLTAVATGLDMVPAAPAAAGGLGAVLVAILWGAIALFGLVRVGGQRRVLEVRVDDAQPLVPLLVGVPGLDQAALVRLAGLGVRSVGDLRRIDGHALAFWAGLPATTVLAWHDAVVLLQWTGLPPGAGERLALSGRASLVALATSRPADIVADLRAASTILGPGLPLDEAEAARWVAEARAELDMPPLPPELPAPVMRSSVPASASTPAV